MNAAGYTLAALDSSNSLIGLSNGAVSAANGVLSCSFTKDNAYNPQKLNLDQLYILVAFGSGMPSLTLF